MQKIGVISAALCAAIAVHEAEAKVESATPFADNMVLQREMKVPVWGTAEPGESVTVTFAGQKKSAVADASGKWRVALDPMPASKESRVLRIAGPSNAEEVKNVLVGEVWFASGQSNMECPIWGPNPRYRDGRGRIMVSATRRPFIRYAKNAKNCSASPRLGWKGVWRDYSPESFQATYNYNLSATAFYFALELYSALEIPVGIVDSSWGGTRIEPWTPLSALPKAPVIPENPGSRVPTALWNGMVAGWAPMAMRGFIWYQGCSNAGDGMAYCAKMHNLYDGWAKEFENPGLKLYFVQLAPFSRNWFTVQQAQAKFAAEEKNAALVTTCDIGNNYDIHPNDKASVAKRLALHALKRDYGFADVVDDAPVVSSWRVEGDKMFLSFSDAKQFYVYIDNRSQDVPGFEVAGLTGGFVPAKVCNKCDRGTFQGSELILAAKGVNEPRRVRYLANKPWNGYLYSVDSGLPVGPFELDTRKPEDFRRGAPAKLGDALAVPEIAGFRKVLVADIPATGGFLEAGYAFDETAKAGAFTRVAYVFELEGEDGSVDWAVAAMDAFTDDAAKLGVPAASNAFFQQKVSNLVVRSNRATVPEGELPDGGVIEFFNTNYSTPTKLQGVGGLNDKYDINDSPASNGQAGYGCMQVHNAKAGVTVFALNNLKNGPADVGIGNSDEGEHPDWTFAKNAQKYKTRRLTVLVK